MTAQYTAHERAEARAEVDRLRAEAKAYEVRSSIAMRELAKSARAKADLIERYYAQEEQQ